MWNIHILTGSWCWNIHTHSNGLCKWQNMGLKTNMILKNITTNQEDVYFGPVMCGFVHICCVLASACVYMISFHSLFSVESPIIILPPRLLVFSTDSAVLNPCSCFPRPCPSRNPYFCMILWATVPLNNTQTSIGLDFAKLMTLYTSYINTCVMYNWSNSNIMLQTQSLHFKFQSKSLNINSFLCQFTVYIFIYVK